MKSTDGMKGDFCLHLFIFFNVLLNGFIHFFVLPPDTQYPNRVHKSSDLFCLENGAIRLGFFCCFIR